MSKKENLDGLEYDVVIIGLGTTGAVLANLLGMRGLKTLVLEREGAAYNLPRAVGFDDEVMRIFQTIGLSSEILEATQPHAGVKFVDKDGKQILLWPRPDGITKHGWRAAYRFHQPQLEGLLRQGMERFASVETRFRCDVFAIDDGEDAATVRYEDLNTGRLHQIRTKFIVGCDGARSLTRRFIGSSLDDLQLHERWLIVDVILNEPKPELGDYTVQFCNADRPATYIRGLGDRRRWEISLRPDEQPNDMMRHEAVWSLLSPWLKPDEAEVERVTAYMFHSAVAQTWRKGRLLLAGDAAHQTPPFMAQGMCAGVRDAFNLAWKLDWIVNGKAPIDLLDTFESERILNVREYITAAVRLGGLVSMKDPEEVFKLANRDEKSGPVISAISPRLGPGLFAADDELAGQPIPQPRLADGRLLDDHIGYNFSLLVNGSFCNSLNLKNENLADFPVTVIEDSQSPELQKWLEEVGAKAVLVRPDRYVFGTASTAAELQSLVSTALNSCQARRAA